MTLEKVKKIITKYLGVKEEKIKPESNFVTDLGADSIDLVEILMALEEEFSVSIPDEVIPEVKTVAELVAYIDKSKK